MHYSCICDFFLLVCFFLATKSIYFLPFTFTPQFNLRSRSLMVHLSIWMPSVTRCLFIFFINHTSPRRCYVSQAALLLILRRTNGGTTWHICWPGWTGRRAVMTSWCLFHTLLSADVGGPPRKLWAMQDWELFFSAEWDDAESVGAKNKK